VFTESHCKQGSGQLDLAERVIHGGKGRKREGRREGGWRGVHRVALQTREWAFGIG
jgi:hypothetical protein